MIGWVILALVLIGLTAAVYSVFMERFWLDVKRVEIHLPKLSPGFHGFTIALFSDTHLGFFYSANHLDKVVRLISAQQPDLICFAGDLVESKKSIKKLKSVIPILCKLKSPYGKYAILGNHDVLAGSGEVSRVWEKGGFQVLVNQVERIQKDGTPLFLIGLDDVRGGNPQLERIMDQASGKNACILLVHEPDFADQACQYPIDLQLSGHSHGGQVCLPWGKPILTTKLGRKYPAGLYRVQSLFVYTSKGIGTTKLPIRFCCRPEITLITLR